MWEWAKLPSQQRRPAMLRPGSCVGLALYHPRLKTGALAHIVLPTASGRGALPGKFADTALPQLLAEFARAGIPREAWWPKSPEAPACSESQGRCKSATRISKPSKTSLPQKTSGSSPKMWEARKDDESPWIAPAANSLSRSPGRHKRSSEMQPPCCRNRTCQ